MKHVARKRFGQHFLVDEAVIGRIVDEIAPRPTDALVEIGPGLGALTRPVLQRCPRLTVVELDRDLAARWRRHDGVTVIEADALTVDWAALADAAGQPLRIIGNLPYNISTPILFSLLPVAHRVVDQHFMLQREVVQRMVAAPGSKAYGRLSVMLQWRYAMEAWADVPPEAFDPPPQVDSAMVHLVPRPLHALVGPTAGAAITTATTNAPSPEALQAAAAIAAVLEPLVQAAFSQRRKLLRHGLGPWLEAAARQRGMAPPAFDLQRRAEEVPVQAFVELAVALAGAAPPGV